MTVYDNYMTVHHLCYCPNCPIILDSKTVKSTAPDSEYTRRGATSAENDSYARDHALIPWSYKAILAAMSMRLERGRALQRE